MQTSYSNCSQFCELNKGSFTFLLRHLPSENFRNLINVAVITGKEEDPANKPKPAFKFGIPPKTAQETNGPLVGGDQTDIAEPEKTEFKFGAPPTKSDKPAFTFGIPSTSSDQPNFKFGVPAAKEPEKPGVKFGVPSTKSIEPLKADFRFGVPASIQSQEPAKPAFSFGLSTQIVAEADKEPRASSPSFVFNQGSTDTQQPLSSGNKTKESTPNLGTSNFQPTAGAGGLGGPSIVEPFAFGKPNLTESSTPAPILTNATTATREVRVSNYKHRFLLTLT